MDYTPLESDEQARVVAYAKRLGYQAHKLRDRADPDYVFVRARPKDVFYVEFKRWNKDARENQASRHRGLRHEGFDVYVVDCREVGYAILQSRQPA